MLKGSIVRGREMCPVGGREGRLAAACVGPDETAASPSSQIGPGKASCPVLPGEHNSSTAGK